MSIVLQAVAFNTNFQDGQSNALNIRRNATQEIAVPEWQRGVTFSAADSPAAYSLEDVMGRQVFILARFSRLLPGISFAEIRAVQPLELDFYPTAANVLGEVAAQTIVFKANGDSDFVPFALLNTRFSRCGVGANIVRWRWQYRLGPGLPWLDFAYSEHKIYTVLRVPPLPWLQVPTTWDNTQLPWTDALDYACLWANSAQTPQEAARAITNAIYSLGRGLLRYDCSLGASAYAFDVFLLSEFIELLSGGIGRGRYVNCIDCATIVSTFANVVGADLWQSRMGSQLADELGYFPVYSVKTIGSMVWGLPCDWWPGWTFHEVAWTGNCGPYDLIYDACLQLDLYPPQQVGMSPADMPFSDSSKPVWLYRPLLVPPGGWPLCEPMRLSRRRRPVI